MKRKILSFLLTMTLMMTSMPVYFFAAQVDAQSNEPYIDLEQQTMTESAIKAEETQKYHGDGFDVDFKVTNQWSGAFNASISISNTGKKALENWSLSFQFEHEITNIWGAEIVSHEGNTYIIKNVSYNQDIAVGDSVIIGFSANWLGQINVPINYDMLIQEEQLANEDYTIDFKVTSDWGSAFNGKISITNNTEEDIEDWILEFDFDREITSFWTASIEKHEDDHYVVKNAGYNANIKAGETLTLGFAGTPGDVNDEPENYILNQIGQEMDEEADIDGDGLVNGLEKIWGTDLSNPDTDGDGLPDGYEFFNTYTDSLLIDTDKNGINDADEDFDQDGLTNMQEYKIKTDPLAADTDSDGLPDEEEVNKYYTDPLITDTDEDGLIDGDDVLLGFDPHLKDTNSNGVWDSAEKIEQSIVQKIDNNKRTEVESVSVTLSCAGNIKKVVTITDMYNKDILSSDVVGLIGVPVEINSNQEFEEAQLTFTYNENSLGDIEEEDLAIMWYDQENNIYRILDKDSVIDMENNTVTYTTTHFSTYLLVDRQKWYNAWKYDIDYTKTEETKLFYDIGLIVDVSGSMWGSRLNNTKAGLVAFIDNMYEGDEASLVTFSDSAYLIADFGSTREKLIAGVKILNSLGGTNVSAGLNLGISKLIAKDSTNNKIVILICDGDVNNVDSIIEEAKEENIKIYTINITYAASHTYLEKIANDTGGKYYYATTAEQLTNILMAIQCQTITGMDTTDTDGDGLYDIMETKGIRIQNGKVIYSDPLVEDTDHDGLIDSEETILVGEQLKFNYSQCVDEQRNCCQIMSYANEPDSDFDGILDSKEAGSNNI